MAQTPAQERASDRVAAWLSQNEKNPTWLVEETGADPGTIGDFLNRARWPKTGTQGKIEKALGWPPGSLRRIGNGSDPDDVGAVLQDADYVSAPGEEVEGVISNEQVLQAINEMRREFRALQERLDRRSGS